MNYEEMSIMKKKASGKFDKKMNKVAKLEEIKYFVKTAGEVYEKVIRNNGAKDYADDINKKTELTQQILQNLIAQLNGEAVDLDTEAYFEQEKNLANVRHFIEVAGSMYEDYIQSCGAFDYADAVGKTKNMALREIDHLFTNFSGKNAEYDNAPQESLQSDDISMERN